MENVWLASAVWLGLALFASIISIRVAMSVALVEIMVGAVAGNTIGLHLTEWVNFLAGFGAILLTFLAGTEIDSRVVRRHFWSSMTIGVVGFFAPYIGVLMYARYAIGWTWPEAQIAGISLSTTSVAVVYAVMVETGFNKTELGKIILAACFVNDLGTVLALGNAVLFSESGLAGGFPRCGRRGGAHCGISRDQDGDKVRRHPAADENLPLRSQGRDVHHAPDVDRTYLRNDLGAVRPHQPHHRPGEIYHSGHRGDRQRRGADTYRPALVPADLQAD
jgi:hypothetical protein